MEFTAQQIADTLGGSVEGNPEIAVSKFIKIDEDEHGGLSFLANPKYESFIYTTGADVIIVGNDFKAEKEISATLVRVEDPYLAFAALLELYNKLQHNKVGVGESAFVHENAVVGKDVYIGEFAYIGDGVVIGDNAKIYPHTYIGDRTKIGSNCLIFAGVRLYRDTVVGCDTIIHSGVVIGGDGFGFAPTEGGGYMKVAQIGNVIIEDNVEIGSNTTIDRATIGSTIIRNGVKLDNLIQVAHNCEIGENTVIASQTGISGSTKIGKNCMIGGQAGLAGHIKIGDNVKIQAQAGVPSDLKDGEMVMGSPSINFRNYMKSYIHFRNLDKLVDRVAELEKKLK